MALKLRREALEAAFKAAKTKGTQWFRFEGNAPWRMKKGWEPSSILSDIEPRGQYFATHPQDLDPLINPYERRRSFGVKDLKISAKNAMYKEPGVIRAIPTADAKIADFRDSNKWEQFILESIKDPDKREKIRKSIGAARLEAGTDEEAIVSGIYDTLDPEEGEITRRLLDQDYTHVMIPDIAARQFDIPQVVSLVPKKTIGSYKGKYKLLGLGAATGVGASLMLGGDQDEVKAMQIPGPRGKFYREVLKVAKTAMVPFKHKAYEKGIREVEEDAVKRANIFKHYKDYSLDYPKTIEAGKILSKTKNDLREIRQEAFTPDRISSVEPYETWKKGEPNEGQPFDPIVGLFDPIGKKMWFEKNALIRHEGSAKMPTVPHEVYHAIQGEERIYPKNAEGVYKPKQGHEAYRDELEKEARQFAEIVRNRSNARRAYKSTRITPPDFSTEDLPPKYGKWLVPSAAGAIGTGTALIPNDQAEAGGKERFLGEMIEAGAKKFYGKESRTAAALLGKPFKGGVIMDVVHGAGDMRYIILDNDVSYPVSKDLVAALTRKYGTSDKMRDFELQPDYEAQITQAHKSLKYHLRRGHPDKTSVLDYHLKYMEQLKTVGVDPPNLSLVESDGVFFTMPREYVDLLGREGAPIKVHQKTIK